MFGLLTVHGTFRLRSREVQIAEDPTRSSVTAIIDAESFVSGNAKRDRDVTAPGLLDAGTYPEITFVSDRVRPDGAGWVIGGQLSAHGTSAATELRLDQASFRDGAVRFHATARDERADFGITNKKGMVGQTADVTIESIGQPT